MSKKRNLKRLAARKKMKFFPTKKQAFEIQKKLHTLDYEYYENDFKERIIDQPKFERMEFDENIRVRYPNVKFPFLGQGFIGIKDGSLSIYHIPYLIDGISTMRNFNGELIGDLYIDRAISWELFMNQNPLSSYQNKSIVIWDNETEDDRLSKIMIEYDNFKKNNKL